MMMKTAILRVIFCCVCFYRPVFADSVTLKSGQVIEGKIVESNDKYTKINFNDVGLVYFQDEIASINEGGDVQAAKKELASIYEAFSANNKAAASLEPEQEVIKQQATNNPSGDFVLPANMPKNIDMSSGNIQSALAQLPKEYQDMVKTSLENLKKSGVPQLPTAAASDLSNLPPEYRDMVKAALEKVQLAGQGVKK